MVKCFITKLKSVVENTDLLKINELRIKISKVTSPSAWTQGITLLADSEVKLSIIGDGYFTNESLSTNEGKEKTIPSGSETIFYVSNGDYSISVLGKYSLAKIYFVDEYKEGVRDNKSMDLDSISYSRNLTVLDVSNKVDGDLSSLARCTALQYLSLPSSDVTGDLSNLKGMQNMVHLALSSEKTVGDLSAVFEMKDLEYLLLTCLTGDFSALASLSKLKTINITLGSEVADIASISSLAQLEELSLNSPKASGDISKIPAKCSYASLDRVKSTEFTWSNRPSSSSIFGISGSPVINNIDKMLQDMSSCVSFKTNSTPSWKSVISATGTRTSASDAAVQTLQSKGYTVSITPA